MNANTGPARTNGQRFGRKSNVEAKKPKTHNARNVPTAGTDSSPAGKCRPAVRGLTASRFRSARRLIAIAADRAHTMHRTMPSKSVRRNGTPGDCQARTALKSANGNAKTV